MSDTPKKKKRWWKRRWVIWSLWMPGVVFGLFFGGFVVLTLVERARWQAELDQLEEWGESVDMKDFALEAVPDDQNVLADPWFAEMRKEPLSHLVSAKILGLKEEDFLDGEEFYYMGWEDPSAERGTRFAVAREDYEEPISREENLNIAREYIRRFEENGDAAKQLDRLFSLPHWQDPKTGTHQDRNELENEYSLMIDMMRLQGRLSSMYALTGQTDKAMHHLRLLASIDKWFDGQNDLIGVMVQQTGHGMLVNYIWELLQCDIAGEEELAEIATWLEDGGPKNMNLLEGLRANTAYCVSVLLDADAEAFSQILDGLNLSGDVSMEARIKGHLTTLELVRLRNCRVMVQHQIPYFKAYDEGAYVSLHHLGQVMDERINDYFKGADDKIFHSLKIAEMALGGYSSFLRGVTTNLAMWRVTKSQVAVQRYYLAEGKYPTGFADLVPVFLSEVHEDPFDGQSLRWTSDESGKPLIYSIGPDLTDDGGEELDSKVGDVRWLMTERKDDE